MTEYERMWKEHPVEMEEEGWLIHLTEEICTPVTGVEDQVAVLSRRAGIPAKRVHRVLDDHPKALLRDAAKLLAVARHWEDNQ